LRLCSHAVHARKNSQGPDIKVRVDWLYVGNVALVGEVIGSEAPLATSTVFRERCLPHLTVRDGLMFRTCCKQWRLNRHVSESKPSPNYCCMGWHGSHGELRGWLTIPKFICRLPHPSLLQATSGSSHLLPCVWTFVTRTANNVERWGLDIRKLLHGF
jgi:hypothetical protein